MSVTARKIASLLRCVQRAREERTRAGGEFRANLTAQDAAILNVTRACESAIDLANMVIRKQRLGVPGDARESFALLERNGLIGSGLSDRLRRMVGFRNIAVHQYRDLDLDILESVLQTGLDDLLAFAELARPHLQEV